MKFLKRFFEILPLTLALLTISLPLFFLHVFPSFVYIFILIYIFLWFMRAMEYAFFLIFAYRKYKKAIKTNWLEKIEKLKNTDILPQEVIHLVIIPTYKEEIEILIESIGSIVEANYDKKNIYLALATEERDHDRGQKNAQIIEKKFAQQFGQFFWLEHPKDLPDEIAGKGANITFAAQEITARLEKEKIDLSKILLTTLDADNKVHPDLFLNLTYEFCTHPERQHCSFQPLPLFFNNLWDVPIVNRLISISSSFWHMIESGRPDRLRNFSSHSQPLMALKAMNYWDKTTIVEDGRQYFRSYLHFDGDYNVIPVFLPIYQDALMGKNYFRSLVDQFYQLKRWAFGASDISYFTLGIIQKSKKLPVWKTLIKYFNLIEGHYMWATAALFITVTSARVHFDPSFLSTVSGSHLVVFFSYIFRIALFGIFVSISVTYIMIPQPKNKKLPLSLLWQWILLPFTTILFGSFPALSAQFDLARGKQGKFNVTKKLRKNISKADHY